MAIPERNMILVAVLFAILEKVTSMLGKLNFIWATTVILGGFGSDLEEIDFWFVSVILVAKGLRVFGRRGELHTSFPYLNKIIRFYFSAIQEYAALLSLTLFRSREEAVKYSPSHQVRNRIDAALELFYLVSTVESTLILLRKLFTGVGKLPLIFIWVKEVKEGYHLDNSQNDTLCWFFYNTYSQCVRGSIFDGWKMTIVSYSAELLQSSDDDKQLKGATLLRGLVKEDPRALERLRSIGTIRSVVEMLIDMLNWDSNEFPDKRIRVEAAKIISYLVGTGRNRTLVMAAPDSMESIASLLYDLSQNRNQSSPEYPYSDLCKEGLRIFKELANDHDNRAKMGSNRGLLLKIITLTESNTPELHLRKLAIETLTSIARDQDFREIIGCIDEVLHNFFSLFVDTPIGNEELVPKAGEALGFLLLNNNQNREIRESIRRDYFWNLIPRLISLLNEEERGTYAAIILRNLSAYLEAYPNENIVEEAVQVVELVTEKEGVHKEAAIGLAAQIFNFLSQEDYGRVMTEARAESLIRTLLYVLQQDASRELPNIRRLSILLLIAIMRMNIRTIARGSPLEMDLRNALKGVMNTTSVLETYSTFSGTIGLRSDSMAIPFLAQSAIVLLDN